MGAAGGVEPEPSTGLQDTAGARPPKRKYRKAAPREEVVKAEETTTAAPAEGPRASTPAQGEGPRFPTTAEFQARYNDYGGFE